VSFWCYTVNHIVHLTQSGIILFSDSHFSWIFNSLFLWSSSLQYSNFNFHRANALWPMAFVFLEPSFRRLSTTNNPMLRNLRSFWAHILSHGNSLSSILRQKKRRKRSPPREHQQAPPSQVTIINLHLHISMTYNDHTSNTNNNNNNDTTIPTTHVYHPTHIVHNHNHNVNSFNTINSSTVGVTNDNSVSFFLDTPSS